MILPIETPRSTCHVRGMKAVMVAVIALSGCKGSKSSPPPDPVREAPVAKTPPAKMEPAKAEPAKAPPSGLPCFGDAERIAITGGNVSSIAAGDVDRDGAPDIVVVHGLDDLDHIKEVDDEQVTVLRNDGHGKLIPGDHWRADRSALAVSLADLDGNGALDIVTSAVVFDGTANSSLHVYLNGGDGKFDTGSITPIGTNASASTTGDVTGDGHPEVLVGTPNTIDVYKAHW